MNEYGRVVEAGTVRFERRLPGPIERVWEYLTDAELRGTWFASGPMELRIGGKAELHFQHERLAPHGEVVPEKFKAIEGGHSMTARITRCEPPRLLAFTWGDEIARNASEVTFELETSGDDVLLTLTHRRLASRSETVDTSAGWHTHLGILEVKLRGQTLPPFWPRVEELERDYELRIARAPGGEATGG